jgi:membrane protease YdiL (CAAX protease family)
MTSFAPVPLAFEGDDVAIVVALLGAAILYLLHAYPLSAVAFESQLAGKGTNSQNHSSAILRKRIAGALVFGIGAIGIAWGLDTGFPTWFSLDHPLQQALWTITIAAPALPFVVRSSAARASQALYPEDRSSEWSAAHARRSLASWALYLLGYELFFRGLLTLQLAEWIGMWPALATGTALYALTHLRKGASEAFACVPMGLVFGIAAVQTGAIYAPWLAHVAFACATEVLCARRNPDTNYPL